MFLYIASLFQWMPQPVFKIFVGLLAVFLVFAFVAFVKGLVTFIATIIDAIPFL